MKLTAHKMPRYTDRKIEEALRKCQGMVYVAAKALGCSPNTIKARLEKSQRLRDIVEAESEYVDDVAEMRLSRAIFNGEAWAIKYRLSTKGKERGYTEKQEVVVEERVKEELGGRLDTLRESLDEKTYQHVLAILSGE